MHRVCLIFAAIILLTGIASICAAGDADDDAASDPLSDYLHANRLPLVEARTLMNSSGERSVLLYGYVATDLGKRDAEDQTRDFMDDPDVTINNRIVVRPELLTMGMPANSADGAEPAADDAADGQAADGQAADGQTADNGQADATAADDADLRQPVGNSQEYANQESNDEYMMGSGAAFGGVPLLLAILGSGAIVPPLIAPPIAFGPYYPRFSPSVSPFNPPIVYGAPPVIIVHTYNPGFGGFAGFPRASGPGYFPSPFAAGPAPMFPATGGMPPFPSAMGQGFGGFAGHSFPSGFVGGGFHGGFGGGRR